MVVRLDEENRVVDMDIDIYNQQIYPLLVTMTILKLFEDCLKIQQSYAKDI